MKKRVLSVFLLSLVMPIIASSNKNSISEYTYISKSGSPSRYKVRFNADKSLDLFIDGEWKNTLSVTWLDKNNLNFIVYKSDNPEFFQLFYRDNFEAGLGVLSEDRRTLYIGWVDKHFIFSREQTGPESVINSYINKSDGVLCKAQLNTDNSVELFVNDVSTSTFYIVYPDKKTKNFTSWPESNGAVGVIGVFSADGKTLYLGYFVYSFKLSSNPKLTFDSINVGGITLRSTPEDLIIQYPAAKGSSKNDQTRFSVDGLDDFGFVLFDFEKDRLVHILKYAIKLGEECEYGLPALVQKSVRELTAKYGKPKVDQFSSLIGDPSLNNETRFCENKRLFTWYGEIIIQINYFWVTDESGQPSFGICSIDYDFDSCDSGL